MSKISLRDPFFCTFKAVRLLCYNEVPISRNLDFLNLPITQQNAVSLRSDDHCDFASNFSYYPFFEGNFPLEVRKISGY